MSIIVLAPTSAPMLMTAPIMITQSLPIRAPARMTAPGLDARLHVCQIEKRQGGIAGGHFDVLIDDARPAPRRPFPDGFVVADEDPERALAEGLKARAFEIALRNSPSDIDFGRRDFFARWR